MRRQRGELDTTTGEVRVGKDQECVGPLLRKARKGRLDFALQGKKLSGRWHLVRMRGRPNEKKSNWLLIKAHDEAERGPRDPDILEEQPLSVVSGRSIEEIAQGKGKKRVWHSNRSVHLRRESGSGKRYIPGFGTLEAIGTVGRALSDRSMASAWMITP